MSAPLSPRLDWSLAAPIWAQTLNPIIASPLSGAIILNGIHLINGSTIIAHGLGRPLQGWFITDINGAATIYRSGAINASTLTLTSNAAVVVNIGVF